MIELLAVLTVWRLSSLLVNESGPFDVFARLRHAVGVRYDVYSVCHAQGVAGALCCVWCASLWVAAAVALAVALYRGDGVLITVLDWLGFSAGAVVVESVVKRG